MKIKCGDANPGGGIDRFYNGGCKKELDLIDAYRCAGCGGYFHLDCIYDHFEMDEEHDDARNALKSIIDGIKSYKIDQSQMIIHEIYRKCLKGLDRKPEKPRTKLYHEFYEVKYHEKGNENVHETLLLEDRYTREEAIIVARKAVGKDATIIHLKKVKRKSI